MRTLSCSFSSICARMSAICADMSAMRTDWAAAGATPEPRCCRDLLGATACGAEGHDACLRALLPWVAEAARSAAKPELPCCAMLNVPLMAARQLVAAVRCGVTAMRQRGCDIADA